MTDEPGPVPGQEPMFDLPRSPGSPPAPTRPVAPLYSAGIVRTPSGTRRHRWHASGSAFAASLCGDAQATSVRRGDTREVPDCDDCIRVAYSELAAAFRDLGTESGPRLAAAIEQARRRERE